MTKISLFIILALFISACSTWEIWETTPKVACKNIDWYEAGRRDGSLGRPLTEFENWRLRCADSKNLVNEEFYVAGRNLGLVDYCTPVRAFDLGRSGLIYQNVCPEHTEGEFLTAYAEGARTLDEPQTLSERERKTRIDFFTDLLFKAQTDFERDRLRTYLDDAKAPRSEASPKSNSSNQSTVK